MNTPAPPALYDSWADFYDLTDVDHSACVAFYRSLVTPQMSSMLDLGCGTGSNTCAIARALSAKSGIASRVVALDNSARMLAHARLRAPEIEWMQADFRLAPIEGPFDFIICCFNTMQMVEPAALPGLFDRVRDLLSPAGLFAFDVYRPNEDYLREPPRDRLAKVVTTPEGQRLETREDAVYHPDRRVLALSWRLVDAARPHDPPLARLGLDVYQHDPQELVRDVRAAGLELVERFGDFDRSDFTPQSRKHVIVCRRAN